MKDDGYEGWAKGRTSYYWRGLGFQDKANTLESSVRPSSRVP